MKIFKNTYKKKMKALLEGLEVQKIEHFMKYGKTGDYRNLGETISKRIKEIINK